MYYLQFVIIGLVVLEDINCYSLKKAPKRNATSSNADELTGTDSSDSSERYSRKKHRNKMSAVRTEDSKSAESVVLAIDTGVKQLMSGARPDVVDTITKTLVNFAKRSAPISRAKVEKYDIKPEIIHFRSDKPAMVFEINSRSIISVLKDVLQSKVVRKYMDKFSKEAGAIYGALKKERDRD